MRSSVTLLLLVGACAADPSGEPATATTHISWGFTIDGAPASCDAAGVDTVVLHFAGPGVFATTCPADEFCQLAVATHPCADGGSDVELELGATYQIEFSPEARDFSAYLGDLMVASAAPTISDDAPVMLNLALATIDVRWDLGDTTYQGFIAMSYGGWGWLRPFAPTGTAQLLAPPGDGVFSLALDVAPALFENRVTVPPQGTALAITQPSSSQLQPPAGL